KTRCDKRTLLPGRINKICFGSLKAIHPLELSRRPSRPSGQESTSWLAVALLLIWILDLPEMLGDALGGLALAAIVGTVKLAAFLIRKLVTALSSYSRS